MIHPSFSLNAKLRAPSGWPPSAGERVLPVGPGRGERVGGAERADQAVPGGPLPDKGRQLAPVHQPDAEDGPAMLAHCKLFASIAMFS